MEKGPVYVAGLERSGTSLIFALLASHPNLAMTRRTNLWTHFFEQFGDLAIDDNLDACLEMMFKYRRLVVLDLDEDRLRADFLSGARTYGRLFDCLERQVADRLGKSRWGDKSLNTERYADAIYDAFPTAKIVHMVRDPRDRYASSKTRWKMRRGGMGAGIAEWLDSIELAQGNRERFPDRYMILRYEDLVTDPPGWTRRVCEFIDEEYAPEMLQMGGAEKFRDQGANSSYGSREAGIISTDSIGKYRDILTPYEVAFADRTAGIEMRAYGYELADVDLRGVALLRYRMLDLPVDSMRLTAWRAQNAFRNWRGRPLPAHRIVTDEAR